MNAVDAKTLRSEIQNLFSERLLIQVPSPDTDLLASGLLDSVNLVELLLHLEEQFGFTVPFEQLEIENFRSVNTITELVESKRVAA
jgi:acyl carrier protein